MLPIQHDDFTGGGVVEALVRERAEAAAGDGVVTQRGPRGDYRDGIRVLGRPAPTADGGYAPTMDTTGLPDGGEHPEARDLPTDLADDPAGVGRVALGRAPLRGRLLPQCTLLTVTP